MTLFGISHYKKYDRIDYGRIGLWTNRYMAELVYGRVISKPLNHDGQHFYQYQQNKQSPLTLKSLNTIKTRTHNIGNSGTGSGRANTLFCGY